MVRFHSPPHVFSDIQYNRNTKWYLVYDKTKPTMDCRRGIFYSLLRYITVFLLNSIFWFITIPYSIFKGNFLPKKGDKRKIWINKTDLK